MSNEYNGILCYLSDDYLNQLMWVILITHVSKNLFLFQVALLSTSVLITKSELHTYH